MIFHDLTKEIFDWIEKQPNVKEESITDWMLYELSKRCFRIRYYAFTHNEESISGADWEWWVLTDNYAYRFRVQAKKLKVKKDNYGSICYSNNHGLQIELLIDDAERNNAFPLYMFYSAEKQETSLAIKYYRQPFLIKMLEWCRYCKSGAFLSPAKTVYAEVLGKPKQKLDASYLLNISLKLSCLDQLLRHCDEPTFNNLAEEYLDKLYQKSKKYGFDFQYKYGQSNNLHKNNNTVPRWLSYISGSGEEQGSLEISEWFEMEFRLQLPDVAGVVTLDLRQKL